MIIARYSTAADALAYAASANYYNESINRETVTGAKLLKAYLAKTPLNNIPRDLAQWRVVWDTVDGKTWWQSENVILMVDPIEKRVCPLELGEIAKNNPELYAAALKA